MFRKVHSPKMHEQDIVHFSLHGLLAEEDVLVLNTVLGTLSHLVCKDNRPYMLMEQQFTTGEICALIPLLESYPYFCPYEVLCASFHSGRVAAVDVERHRKRLQEAQEAGIWDQEIRPIRGVLSRARFKMRAFGIEISPILETGYLLRKESRSPVAVS